MSLLATVLLFVLGLGMGLFWFATIVLPICYGIPRSLYWWGRGWVRIAAPLRSLVAPVLGSLVLLALAWGLLSWFPNAASHLWESKAFAFGQEGAILIGTFRALFGAEERRALRADFESATAPYLTVTGRRRVFPALQALADSRGFSLQEVAATPPHAMEIVGAYGRLLGDAPSFQVRPESSLPYPKHVIAEALRAALSAISDTASQRALQIGLSELDGFVPDREVPGDPDERATEWLRRCRPVLALLPRQAAK
jgi:hypothetical protein